MNLTCVVCPVGCEITAEVRDGEIVSLKGNACKRGAEYAKEEILNPRRTLTTTMRTENGQLIPVKSSQPLPKARLMEFMAILKSSPPIICTHIGQILIPNIAGTGIDIIATGEP